MYSFKNLIFRFTLVFFLFINLLLISAEPFESEKGTTTIMTSNDCFGGEFVLDRDDFRSYGFGMASVFDEGYSASFEYYGHTDREQNSRSDELLLDIGYIFNFYEPYGELSLFPLAGARLTGNIAGQALQNFVHRFFGIKEVDMVYDEGRNDQILSADFTAGLSLSWQKAFPIFTEAELIPAIQTSFEYSVPSGYLLNTAALLKLNGVSDDRFSFFTGYSMISTDFPGSTIDNSLELENGFYTGFKLAAGMLAYETVIYPQSGFANGYISLTLNTGNHDKVYSYKKPDFILDYMLDLISYEKEIKMLFPLESVGSFRILPFADFSYADALSDFYNTERQVRLMQLSAGAQIAYTPGFFSSPFEVYAGAGAGYRLEKYWDLEDFISYSSGMVLQPEAGIRTKPIALFPSSGLFKQNSRYGISINYGLQWLPFGDLYVKLQHRLSLGLEIWCDY